MASPPSIQRFYPDDYREAPTWFKTKFLDTLNLFVFPTYNAINKNLTVGANLNQAYYTLSLTGSNTATNNTASFLNPIQGNPTGITVVNVQITGLATPTFPTSAVQCFFTFDGMSINVGSITGLTDGTSYDITLKVE